MPLRISFFEEFPTKKNLEKLKLVNWPTKLYLAAKSLEEFEMLKRKNSTFRQVRKWIYWPILEKKEGYWISPFSKREALVRIFSELKDKRIPVMLDLELPTTQNPLLYFSQLPFFFANKRLISSFIQEYRGEVYLAEYYPERRNAERVMEILGIHYKNKRTKVIKMFYHSVHNFGEKFLRDELQLGKKEFQKKYLLAYGTISSGIAGNEPLLKPEILHKDLLLAQKNMISEIVIFRLGGLNKKYVKIIEKFV
ncbi:hypothetical protein HYX13_05820 [Candidatus Woesearchaeota archaeon]|nr:hypothetical protein [Candidatus Woesearchaeota archaeon]